MDDSTEKLPDKKAFLIIGIFFGILVLLSVAFFLLANFKKNGSGPTPGIFTGNEQELPGKPTSLTPVPTYPPPPKFHTDSWTVSNQNPPANILASQQYGFKQNYTLTEVRTFAQKLFNPTIVKTSKNLILAYTTDTASRQTEALRFNPQSGAFAFISNKGIPLTGTISNDSLYQFLQSIDLYDPAMQVTAQYRTSANPELTYFEIHRDWRRMGLPLLNFIGLLNLPEGQQLNSLSLNSAFGAALDPTITTATDGKSGLARQNDFNTITIVVSNVTHKIIAIESNMRKLDTAKTQTQNLLTYAEAETKLKTNNYSMILSTPAGDGTVPWEKVYPLNRADASNAVVTDAMYAYLEQSPTVTQSELKPYVLFKGYATLKNGYRSTFVAAVPATQTNALGATDESDGTLLAQQQQGQPSPRPTAVNPTTGPTPPPGSKACVPTVDQLQPRFTFQGVTLGLRAAYDVHNDPASGKPPVVHVPAKWYWIPPENFATLSHDDKVAVLQHDWNVIINNLEAIEPTAVAGGASMVEPTEERKRGDEHGIRDWGDILRRFLEIEQNFSAWCPIPFSGYSPSVFFYGDKGQTIQAYPSQVMYADPALNFDHWTVTINGDFDLLVNGVSRPYAYYEYSSVNFNKPRYGWNVDKTQLETFARKVGTQLGLNSTETDRLTIELDQAAARVDSGRIFVGLVDAQELNKKLPLKLTPQPEKVYRYHFYMSEAGNKVSPPKLNPIQRSNFMVVEVGAHASQ